MKEKFSDDPLQAISPTWLGPTISQVSLYNSNLNLELVKKVESTLLNLEKKQPSNLDFFKQPNNNNGPPTSQPKLSNPGLASVITPHKDNDD